MRVIAETVRGYHDTDGKFKKGERVRHPRWGAGTILKVTGKGDDVRVTVRFDSGEEKTLMPEYARLERI